MPQICAQNEIVFTKRKNKGKNVFYKNMKIVTAVVWGTLSTTPGFQQLYNCTCIYSQQKSTDFTMNVLLSIWDKNIEDLSLWFLNVQNVAYKLRSDLIILVLHCVNFLQLNEIWHRIHKGKATSFIDILIFIPNAEEDESKLMKL